MLTPATTMSPLLLANTTSAVTALTYRSHTENNGSHSSIPAGVQVGDLLIALERAYHSNGISILPAPTGWTYVASAAGDRAVAMAVKVADGTETGTVSLLSRTSGQSMVVALEGEASSLGAILDTDVQAASGALADQTKNAATIGTKPFVVLAGYGASNSGANGSFTGDTPDHEVLYDTGQALLQFRYKFYGAVDTPSDITVGTPSTNGPTRGLVSGIVELT